MRPGDPSFAFGQGLGLQSMLLSLVVEVFSSKFGPEGMTERMAVMVGFWFYLFIWLLSKKANSFFQASLCLSF